MAKFCPECGALTQGMKFCPECGADLRGGAVPQEIARSVAEARSDPQQQSGEQVY